MSNKKIEELLEEWQNRLGLQDWAICLRYDCKPDDLQLEDCSGETQWSTSIKDACIKIVSKEYCEDRICNYDFEQILVHELLHLKFGLLDIGNNSYESKVTEEVRHQLIDDLARAFIMTKRNEQKRELGCSKVKKMYEENVNEKKMD